MGGTRGEDGGEGIPFTGTLERAKDTVEWREGWLSRLWAHEPYIACKLVS